MMKPFHSIVVFLLLALSSALTGMKSYSDARQRADADLQQALVQTLATQPDNIITPDTIQNYRASLAIDELRETAWLSYTLRGEIRASCPAAAVWHISDQRLSFLLSLLAALWAVASVLWFRHKIPSTLHTPPSTLHTPPSTLHTPPSTLHTPPSTLGGLRYDACSQTFYDAQNLPVHLTPMQHHLLTMFFLSPTHELSHQTICDALWPKKPDASDTLYALIRRLKTVIAACSTLRIEVDRGRSYRLQNYNIQTP